MFDLFLLLQLSKSSEEETTVKVKISGDGARMSNTSSLFVCSFSLLEEGQRMLSSAGTVLIFNSNTKDCIVFFQTFQFS